MWPGCLSVLDFVHAGSRSLCGSLLNLAADYSSGSADSVFWIARLGGSFPVIDFFHLGSSLSIRSSMRLGCSLPVFEMNLLICSLSVSDFVQSGSALSLHSIDVVWDSSLTKSSVDCERLASRKRDVIAQRNSRWWHPFSFGIVAIGVFC